MRSTPRDLIADEEGDQQTSDLDNGIVAARRRSPKSLQCR